MAEGERGRSTYQSAGAYQTCSWDDGKSAFGVSEVAIPKQSFKRGVVRGDGGSTRRIQHAQSDDSIEIECMVRVFLHCLKDVNSIAQILSFGLQKSSKKDRTSCNFQVIFNNCLTTF